jgi:hypothetical protein
MGRNGNHRNRMSDTQRQAVFDRHLSALEAQVKAESKKKNECVAVPNTKRIVYAGARCLPAFTADDLLAELLKHGLHAINMEHNMKASEEIMFGHLSKHVVEVPPRIRLYFRTSDNINSFARLQHCVEQIYLEESLPILQGWIINVGSMFVIAPPHLSLTNGACRVIEALNELQA